MKEVPPPKGGDVGDKICLHRRTQVRPIMKCPAVGGVVPSGVAGAMSRKVCCLYSKFA